MLDGELRQLRKAVVAYHVSCVSSSAAAAPPSSPSSSASASASSSASETIRRLLTTLQRCNPAALPAQWVAVRAAALCDRAAGLAAATRTLSGIRKEVRRAPAKAAAAQALSQSQLRQQHSGVATGATARRDFSSPRSPTATRVPSAPPTPAPPSYAPPPPPPPTPPLVSHKLTHGHPMMVVDPPPPAPAATQPTLEELKQAEFKRLGLFQRRASLVAQYEEEQIDHIVQASLGPGATASTGHAHSLPLAAAPALPTHVVTDNHGGGDVEAAAGLTGLSGLESIAATPLKVYRPPADDAVAALSSTLPDPSSLSFALAVDDRSPPPPPPTPLPAMHDNRQQQQQPQSQQLSFSHLQSSPQQTPAPLFGLESQISAVGMEQSYLALSGDTAAAANAVSIDDLHTSAVAADSSAPARTTTAARESIAHHQAYNGTERLGNQDWAQQVVAAQQQQRPPSNSSNKAPGLGQRSSGAARTGSRRRRHKRSRARGATLSSADEVNAAEADGPALSGSRTTIANATALAARRARRKACEAKEAKAKHAQEAQAKRERLRALEREAAQRRAQAARRRNERSGARSRGPRSKVAADENAMPASVQYDHAAIERSRRRTLERLRAQTKKLREKEAEQQRLADKKANEKWRLRDAKLAVDQQRRLQRQRFLEIERASAASKISNSKIRKKSKPKKTRGAPVSILKTSTRGNWTRDPAVRVDQDGGSDGDAGGAAPPRSARRRVKAMSSPLAATNGAAPVSEVDFDADVSAVFEDVEAWVASVYGGESEPPQTTQVDHLPAFTQHQHAEIDARTEQQQQAADDEAFLDAILQATE